MDVDNITAAAACVIIIATVAEIMRQTRNRHRRVWVSDLLSSRNERGAVNNLLPQLEERRKEQQPPNELVPGPRSRVRGTYSNYMRMDEQCFDRLLNLVRPLIQKEDTVMRLAITPEQRLAVTLRYLATGATFTDLYYNFRISVSSLTTIIPETCEAIYTVLKDSYIKTPTTQDKWLSIASRIYSKWQFPNCIGALDGKHVILQKPWHAGSYYHNYKGTESIVLMALCDADYKYDIIIIIFLKYATFVNN